IRERLPAWLVEKIAHPPTAGNGVNPWLYRVARQLHCHFSEEQIYQKIRATTNGCGRPIEEREIWRAIRNSKRVAYTLTHGGSSAGGYGTDFQASTPAPPSRAATRAWPERDKAKIDSIVREGCSLCDLWESSPILCNEEG